MNKFNKKLTINQSKLFKINHLQYLSLFNMINIISMINKDYFSLDSLEMELILNVVMPRIKATIISWILYNFKSLTYTAMRMYKKLDLKKWGRLLLTNVM